MVLALIEGNSWNHLWYLYMLIGIVAFLPIYKSFFINSISNIKIYVTVLILVIYSIEPIIKEILGIEILLYPSIGNVYVAYFFLGALVSEKKSFNKKNSLILLVFSALIYIVGISLYCFSSVQIVSLNGYSSPCNIFLFFACVRGNLIINVIRLYHEFLN